MARRRSLPSAAEAAAILGQKRSRGPIRPPPPVGRSLSRYVKDMEERFGKGSGGLAARWSEIIADDRLARLTEPVKVIRQRGQAGSILELKVDGPAAALIQHRADEILSRVNLVLGGSPVTRLRIVQGAVKARPASPSPAARRRPLGPLDAASEAALRESLSHAPETPLKAALLKLGRAVIQNQTAKLEPR